MAYDFSTLKTNIKETEEWLSREFSTIRTGRASAALLDGIKPEAYGARTPLAQLASVSIEDARTIRIVPWDTSVGKAIEKAITEADLGVSVVTDEQGLRVIFPELTAERRAMLTKLAGQKLEEARQTLRGHRAEEIKSIEAAEKAGGMGKDEVARLKDEVQNMIDAGNVTLDTLLSKKQQDISQ
ncbi:ribosome recycling factor [Candidatus Parcubacteria bacterium]|nr:ribosome recycling factor [Candidatus Parcubacteria bacterium]